MRNLDAIIKAYDVRGTYPDQLDEELAHEVGGAFVRVVGAAARDGGPGAVVIAHDMRPSGPSLVASFAEGVREQGCDVVLIGLASTDGLYFASGSARAARRHVHREPQPGPVQRHQAVPPRRLARRARTPASARSPA